MNEQQSSPRILFLSKSAVHLRFFEPIARALGAGSRVEMVRPSPPGARDISQRLSDEELECMLRVHVARRVQQRPVLRKYPALLKFYRRVLFARASRLHAYWLHRLQYEREQWDAVGVWNGLRAPESLIVAAARQAGIPVLFFELGPLPDTLAVDRKGVNFANSVPREAEFFRNPDWPSLEKGPLVPRKPRRGKRADEVELPPRFLFAPFQVNFDTQVVGYSPWVPEMHAWYDVLARLQKRLRDEGDKRVVVLREHPTCKMRYPDLHARSRQDGMLFANGNDMEELLRGADAVLTLNSSVGIEALLRECKVIVAGQAFYDIPGITLSAGSEDELYGVVEKLDAWEPDAELRDNFLAWLQHVYLVSRFDPALLYSESNDERRLHEARLADTVVRIETLLASR